MVRLEKMLFKEKLMTHDGRPTADTGRSVKFIAYLTLLRLHLEYGSLVRSPEVQHWLTNWKCPKKSWPLNLGRLQEYHYFTKYTMIWLPSHLTITWLQIALATPRNTVWFQHPWNFDKSIFSIFPKPNHLIPIIALILVKVAFLLQGIDIYFWLATFFIIHVQMKIGAQSSRKWYYSLSQGSSK